MSDYSSGTVPATQNASRALKPCGACGVEIDARAEICPKCGVRQRTPVSKAALLLITFFLGGIGAHKFYLGKYWQGALYLIFSWTSIPGLIALIEFIVYVFTSSDRLNEKYSAKGFLVVTIMAIVGFVFIIGVLAAVALPAYQDYIKRAKAHQGAAIGSEFRRGNLEAFASKRPSDIWHSFSKKDIIIAVWRRRLSYD